MAGEALFRLGRPGLLERQIPSVSSAPPLEEGGWGRGPPTPSSALSRRPRQPEPDAVTRHVDNNPTAMEAEETMECLQEFPEHHKMILDRLNEQREQDRFTDITLIVDGHHFKAHKAVLAACSKFFYKFFQEFTQEPLVEIEGVSKMAFRHLIEFTYTAKLMIQGEEEANDVWKAAEFLQMLEAIKALEVRVGAEDEHLQQPSEYQPSA
ncbi:hypothetical protein J1605_013600 [Eschrichtius robustus]|uniref:BTB domain-containing protein n=1 Tax=Eschrichtius robustus TaxID=9764 RepID=A0AB34GES0_ESCRO|nr:hypothetical protein J1605_013600 [Eschrichtius robustus]